MRFIRLFALLCLASFALASGPASAQAAPTGPKIRDFIMLKDGTSINGDVKVVEFILKTKYGSLPIPKLDVLEIEYRKPPNLPEDEIQVSAGTRMRGDVGPAVLKVDVDGLGLVDIPKSDILAIVISRPLENLSPATKKALQRK